jgi:hypothetical protein
MIEINKHPRPRTELLDVPTSNYDAECQRQYYLCLEYLEDKLINARKNNEYGISFTDNDLEKIISFPENNSRTLVIRSGTISLLKEEYKKAGYKWKVVTDNEGMSPDYYHIEFSA